jgi:hypothetical protein
MFLLLISFSDSAQGRALNTILDWFCTFLIKIWEGGEDRGGGLV